jgi:Tfp pilus assembly protein PilZ
VVIIKVICQSRADFSAKYLEEFPNGGVFVPTRRVAKPGDPVLVSLRIGSRATPVLLRACVRWVRRGKIVPKIRAGLALEFLPSEARGRDHLLSIARRESGVNSPRRHQRIPIDLPVQWTLRGQLEPRSGVLQDVSFGGASVRAKDWLSERDEIVVTVAPPGAAVAMAMSGRIAWTVPGVAFGVAWRARDVGGRQRIKELVRRLEQLTFTRETHDGPLASHSPSPIPARQLR